MVENLRRKKRLKRVAVEKDHAKRVAAERAAGEEKKRIARREEQAGKVSEAAEGVKQAEAVPSPASEDMDVGGGWRVVGGSVVRKVEIVSRLGGPVGRARTAGLAAVVEQVQALFRSEFLGWGVSAKV